MPEMRPGAGHEGRWYERLGRGGAPLAVLIVVGLYLVYKLIFILELIAVAMLLALVVRSALDGLKRIGLPSWLAVVTMLAAIAVLGTLAWFVVIPDIVQEAQKLLIPEGPGSLQQRVQKLISQATDLLSGLPFVSHDFISRLPQRLKSSLSGLVGSLPTTLPTSIPALASTFSAVLVGIITLAFLTIYFAVTPGSYVSIILGLVPRYRRERARRFVDRLVRKLRVWIVGTIIVAVLMGVGAGIGLWIIGIPLPLFFGILVGVLSIIPFIGSAVGGLFPGLLALTISPTKALLVGVLFFILAQADGNVLRPLIFGREFHVPPGMVLLAILVLGTLLGPVIGVFLAIPTAVLVQTMFEELREREPPKTPSGKGAGAEGNPPSGDFNV